MFGFIKIYRKAFPLLSRECGPLESPTSGQGDKVNKRTSRRSGEPEPTGT